MIVEKDEYKNKQKLIYNKQENRSDEYRSKDLVSDDIKKGTR